MFNESSDVSLGGGGMLVPQTQKGPYCDKFWGTFVVFDVALVVVWTVIDVPCVVVVPFVVIVVGILLSVACETMYVTVIVEIYVGVFVAQVVVVTIVFGMKFFSRGVIGILTIV